MINMYKFCLAMAIINRIINGTKNIMLNRFNNAELFSKAIFLKENFGKNWCRFSYIGVVLINGRNVFLLALLSCGIAGDAEYVSTVCIPNNCIIKFCRIAIVLIYIFLKELVLCSIKPLIL